MSRSFVITLIVCVGFIFHGCGALEYVDGSSKDEIEKFKMSKEEMWNELKKARNENTQLQDQTRALQKGNQRIRDENEIKIGLIKDQIGSLDKQIVTLQEENQRLTDENKHLSLKLHRCQLAYETSLSEPHEKAISKIKMKVLSGDGDLNSAKEMAKRLRGAGYTIKIFHHANRADFEHTTVYYLPTFLREAKRLVLLLGEHTIIKPLTWSSAYDLIVVTGNNP
jgi:regulator of replication initiation timing